MSKIFGDSIFRAEVAVAGAYDATIILPGTTTPTQKAYKYAVLGMTLNPGDFVYVIPISGTYVLLGGAVEGGGGGTTDYDDLTDKPSINGNVLSGNKTASQLGLGTYSKPANGIPQTDLASAVLSPYRTAAAQDAIDAAQDAEIGMVITGARPSMAVTAGQYVIVRNSTISGIADGLYTANAALSPSTDVTAANLTAVSGGGLNDLKRIVNYNPALIASGVTLLGRSLMTVYGEFFFFRAVVQVTTAQTQDAELFQLPNYNYDTTTTANVLVSRVDGGNGYTTVSIAANNTIRVVLPGGMATGRYEILLFGKCT